MCKMKLSLVIKRAVIKYDSQGASARQIAIELERLYGPEGFSSSHQQMYCSISQLSQKTRLWSTKQNN